MKIVDLKLGQQVTVRPKEKGGPVILRWGVNRHQTGALARVGIQASHPNYTISGPQPLTEPTFDPKRFVMYPEYAICLTPWRKQPASITIRPLRSDRPGGSAISVECMPFSYIISLVRVEDLPGRRNAADPEPEPIPPLTNCRNF